MRPGGNETRRRVRRLRLLAYLNYCRRVTPSGGKNLRLRRMHARLWKTSLWAEADNAHGQHGWSCDQQPDRQRAEQRDDEHQHQCQRHGRAWQHDCSVGRHRGSFWRCSGCSNGRSRGRPGRRCHRSRCWDGACTHGSTAGAAGASAAAPSRAAAEPRPVAARGDSQIHHARGRSVRVHDVWRLLGCPGCDRIAALWPCLPVRQLRPEAQTAGLGQLTIVSCMPCASVGLLSGIHMRCGC